MCAFAIPSARRAGEPRHWVGDPAARTGHKATNSNEQENDMSEKQGVDAVYARARRWATGDAHAAKGRRYGRAAMSGDTAQLRAGKVLLCLVAGALLAAGPPAP